jgi:hypothetical protein
MGKVVIMPECCPVREHTADKKSVGRCWYHLKEGHICPRHKNVDLAVKMFKESGEMTNDFDLPRTR